MKPGLLFASEAVHRRPQMAPDARNALSGVLAYPGLKRAVSTAWGVD